MSGIDKIFAGADDAQTQQARLIILRALAEQHDYRLNDEIIRQELSRFALTRSIEYVRNQLRWLADNGNAVSLFPAGSCVIAELTQDGLDHVERRTVLAGVMRPSPNKT